VVSFPVSDYEEVEEKDIIDIENELPQENKPVTSIPIMYKTKKIGKGLEKDNDIIFDLLLGIGERLRGIREQAGYTVAEICALLNTTETHYTGIENGDYCLSCDRLITIKGIFGIDLNWLICGEESEPGDNIIYLDTG